MVQLLCTPTTLAAHLPLQDCAEIDETDAAAGAGAGAGGGAGGGAVAAGAAPHQALLRLLDEAEAAYTLAYTAQSAAALRRGDQHEEPHPSMPQPFGTVHSCSGFV